MKKYLLLFSVKIWRFSRHDHEDMFLSIETMTRTIETTPNDIEEKISEAKKSIEVGGYSNDDGITHLVVANLTQVLPLD